MNPIPRTCMTAIIIIALDQLSKWYFVEYMALPARPPITVTSFFNLVMVWNKGVSFGMFSGMEAKWGLIAMSLVICGFLLKWSKSATSSLQSGIFGLVIGGAIGNVIDRLHYGAVADFFDFHLMGYHWPAFNIADMAIVVGVFALMWFEMRKPTKD